jgi:hypothetical protein
MIRPGRHRAGTSALFVILTSLVAACGMAIPVLSGASGGGPGVDVCALVSKDDATRILGQPVGNPTPLEDYGCEYTGNDGAQTLSVSVQSGEAMSQVYELSRLPFGSHPVALVEDVPDLGERAFLVLIGGDGRASDRLAPVTILNVLKKDTMLTVTVGDPAALEAEVTATGSGSLSALKAVAKWLIDRL